ncbi:MAG: nuclear transport factor 2 family protein [Pseudomonadota bacterium]
MTPRAVVEGFWDTMADNDFAAASFCLTEDFEGYWPQSRELIRGRAAFSAVNTAYPAAGPWLFDVQNIVADANMVATNVAITDGDIEARAVTFHWVRGVLIHRQLEYWPDPYPAPAWRAGYVQIIDRPDFPD